MRTDRFEATSRSSVQRHPERGSSDRETIYDILDQGILCHVGLATDDGPVVIPMGYARRGDELILHGSAKSRLLNAIAEGAEVCVTVTLLDALVLARSTFHHSMNYRSVVLFGRGEPITDPEEKKKALETLVDHLVPGRSREARGPSKGELLATLAVRVPIHEASAKVRTGPPVDEKRDLDIPIWAGVLPFETTMGEPLRDEHTGEDVPVPDYIRNYPAGRA